MQITIALAVLALAGGPTVRAEAPPPKPLSKADQLVVDAAVAKFTLDYGCSLLHLNAAETARQHDRLGEIELRLRRADAADRETLAMIEKLSHDQEVQVVMTDNAYKQCAPNRSGARSDRPPEPR